jgi:hypothetical protein
MTGANTLSSMMTQLSSGLGVAVGALAVRAGSGIDHTHSSTPSLADFHIAFLVVAAIGTISLIDVIRLPADAGRAITQRLAPRSANVA